MFQIFSVVQINIKSIHFPVLPMYVWYYGTKKYDFPLKQGFSKLARLSFGAQEFFAVLCILECLATPLPLITSCR